MRCMQALQRDLASAAGDFGSIVSAGLLVMLDRLIRSVCNRSDAAQSGWSPPSSAHHTQAASAGVPLRR